MNCVLKGFCSLTIPYGFLFKTGAKMSMGNERYEVGATTDATTPVITSSEDEDWRS